MDNHYPEIVPEQGTTPTVKQRPAWVGFLWEVLQTLIMAIVLYFLIDTVVGRVRVENISMQPTLHEGQFILVNKLAYRLGDFHRGDIVVFHHTQAEDYIKRVIGLPGDLVLVQNGDVYINGERLEEEYIAASPQYSNEWKVPDDSLFVLGDNRNQSSDSHSWGYVPTSSVVGRAMIVYWPLKELKILNQTPSVQAAQ